METIKIDDLMRIKDSLMRWHNEQKMSEKVMESLVWKELFEKILQYPRGMIKYQTKGKGDIPDLVLTPKARMHIPVEIKKPDVDYKYVTKSGEKQVITYAFRRNADWGIITDGILWEIFRIDKIDPTIRKRKPELGNMKWRRCLSLVLKENNNQLDTYFLRALSPSRIPKALNMLDKTFGEFGYSGVFDKLLEIGKPDNKLISDAFGCELNGEEFELFMEVYKSYGRREQSSIELPDGKWTDYAQFQVGKKQEKQDLAQKQ